MWRRVFEFLADRSEGEICFLAIGVMMCILILGVVF